VVRGPSVAIVIPNWNGVRYLPDCLNSLEALDYPRDLLEVIVVDNGSTDASLELLREHYPWVRVIAHSENLGFAAASNSGASATDAECVAFLNNDMRVDRLWLDELVGAYEPETGYVCVAGVILTWDGSQIDFVDGRINFHGAPSQEHLDLDLDETLIEDGRELPFPCGGSMLISRQVFLDVGAFDPAFFAYCEDVDLGWRLWVLGYKVRLAARSRCFHRRHGTGSTVPFYQRLVLYERNSLLSLVKNVSDENFAPLLTAALFLTIERTLVRGRSDRASYDVGATDGDEVEELPRARSRGCTACRTSWETWRRC
jgi:GT2 family glycosyltransferase